MIKIIRDNVNVQPLFDAVCDRQDLFSMCVARQTFEGSPHEDTASIFVRGPMGWSRDWYLEHTGAMDYPAMELLWPAVEAVIKPVVEELGIKTLGRVMIVSLFAGGRIHKHVDEGAYSDAYQRWHLVLHGDSRSGLRCGDETVECVTGRLFWFNHKLEHEAWNESDEPRINVIIDGVT
jgi:Aspartyl/Asparaginyl beta-hydroxylase